MFTARVRDPNVDYTSSCPPSLVCAWSNMRILDLRLFQKMFSKCARENMFILPPRRVKNVSSQKREYRTYLGNRGRHPRVPYVSFLVHMIKIVESTCRPIVVSEKLYNSHTFFYCVYHSKTHTQPPFANTSKLFFLRIFRVYAR